jgi:type IV pilus assembly protein PilP
MYWTSRTLKSACMAAVAAVALSGCVSNDINDLESQVTEVMARKGGRIDPIPEIPPYERYLYQSADAGGRDPFLPFFVGPRTSSKDDKTADPKSLALKLEIDLHNNPEELENYELDSLRMVGTLENPEFMWAIIREPSGMVHRVTVGNYMGRNFGKILAISEADIELREIIQDGNEYTERVANLALAEE